MEEIQRGEGAEEAGLQQQHQREVERDALFDLPGGEHADGHDDRREQQHQQAEAVDADAVFDAERRDPGVAAPETGSAPEARSKLCQRISVMQQRDEAEGERRPARERLASAAEREHDERADDGQ